MWSLNEMKLLLLAQVVDQGSPRVAGFPFSETYRWDEGKWWVCPGSITGEGRKNRRVGYLVLASHLHRASSLNFKHHLQMRLHTELQKDTDRTESRRCLSYNFEVMSFASSLMPTTLWINILYKFCSYHVNTVIICMGWCICRLILLFIAYKYLKDFCSTHSAFFLSSSSSLCHSTPFPPSLPALSQNNRKGQNFQGNLGKTLDSSMANLELGISVWNVKTNRVLAPSVGTEPERLSWYYKYDPIFSSSLVSPQDTGAMVGSSRVLF